MSKRLFYIPLEGYKERYTEQWSAPVTGWLERNWRKAKIDYMRIDGKQTIGKIEHGSVLDAVGRSKFAFSQIDNLLDLINVKFFTPNDVIYFDDFWHPGIEAIPYALSLIYGYDRDKWPKMYAFLFAQSVDEYDFTYRMKSWIRSFEQGIAKILTGIFVACPMLQRLVVERICPSLDSAAVHVTGHPFSSEEVITKMPLWIDNYTRPFAIKRNNDVVWSSRWDKEKNPTFFLAVTEKVLKVNSDVKFHICTGLSKLRSNDPDLLVVLNKVIETYPNNVFLHEGLNKVQYYDFLAKAKIQFNCASQDWVPLTLLEASVAGCYPIYPAFRAFPETFEGNCDFMYPAWDTTAATNKVLSVLQSDAHWTKEAIAARKWIHSRYDVSWKRMLDIMGFDIDAPNYPLYSEKWNNY